VTESTRHDTIFRKDMARQGAAIITRIQSFTSICSCVLLGFCCTAREDGPRSTFANVLKDTHTKANQGKMKMERFQIKEKRGASCSPNPPALLFFDGSNRRQEKVLGRWRPGSLTSFLLLASRLFTHHLLTSASLWLEKKTSAMWTPNLLVCEQHLGFWIT
jgi:hypothetical protein